MRKLTWFIKLLILAIICYGFFYFMKDDAGYTLISYKNFRFESSLWGFIAFLFILWFGLSFIKGLIKLLFTSLNILNPWSLRNKIKRSEKATERGLLASVEGDYKAAVKQLTKAAKLNEHPLFLLLDAAIAAHKAGDFKQSDDLLLKALEINPKAKRAINITTADLKIKQGQYNQAIEILKELKEEKPNDVNTVKLLLEAYIGQKNIKGILTIIREAYKYSVFSEDELKNIEINTWKEYLNITKNLNNEEDIVNKLEAIWDSIPRAMKTEQSILLTYTNCLIQSGSQNKAEEILRKILPSNYFMEAMKLYGLIECDDIKTQLKFAKKMANDKEDSAALLTLGRIAKKSGDISLAKESFKKVIDLNNDPYALMEFSQILNLEGDHLKACEILGNSIEILSGTNINKSLITIGN